MALIDGFNRKYGPRTMRLAAERFRKSWSIKRQLKSPHTPRDGRNFFLRF